MTQEQKDIFISIMKLGVYCGCNSPQEALLNYTLHDLQCMPYDESFEAEKKAINAFAEFYRESHKNTGEFFDGISDEKFIEWVDKPLNDKLKKLQEEQC